MIKIQIEILEKNLGVGGATIHGFKKAISEGFDIIFKLDGDGQHEPKYIEEFKKSFSSENINYCKGSRFINENEKKEFLKLDIWGMLY